jgi:hypothetical protein
VASVQGLQRKSVLSRWGCRMTIIAEVLRRHAERWGAPYNGGVNSCFIPHGLYGLLAVLYSHRAVTAPCRRQLTCSQAAVTEIEAQIACIAPL